MKRTPCVASLAALAAALLVVSMVAAQSGGGYNLSWNTIAGGGTSHGGGYALGGAIGQADTGTLIGGGYTLAGGYWPGARTQFAVFLPLILRN